MVEEIRRQTRALARALRVVGLMNVQFAVSRGGEIHVLEVNPRASRTVPFVAKTIGLSLARIAARVMAGESLADFGLEERPLDHVAVKEAVFPFARFPGVDVILGPEMKSTGEVMGLDEDFGRAFAKAQLAAGGVLPEGGRAFVSVRDRDKPQAVALGRRLAALGFSLVATRGTAHALRANGVAAETINKVLEGPPHIVDALKDDRIDFLINTTESAKSVADSSGMPPDRAHEERPLRDHHRGGARHGRRHRGRARDRLRRRAPPVLRPVVGERGTAGTRQATETRCTTPGAPVFGRPGDPMRVVISHGEPPALRLPFGGLHAGARPAGRTGSVVSVVRRADEVARRV